MNLNEALKQQVQTSYDTKEGGFQPTTYRIPPGAETYSPQKGTNKIDIIPFFKKDGNPAYMMEYYIHTNIGLDNERVVCLHKTFGKLCPICEESNRMKADGATWDERKDLAPKRRCIYNVVDHLELEKGIKIFEVSHFIFEKILIEDAKDENGESINFPALNEEGKIISFKGREQEYRGHVSVSKFDSFVFLDRKKAYPDSIIKKAYQLDTLLIVPEYKKVHDLFFGVPVDEDDAPEEKASTEYQDDDEPFTSPAETKPAAAAPAGKCPSGFTFGVDIDQHDECDGCVEWFGCNANS